MLRAMRRHVVPPTSATRARGGRTGANWEAGRRALASLAEKRRSLAPKLAAVPEVARRAELHRLLKERRCAAHDAGAPLSYEEAGLTAEDVRLSLDAGLATFLLHVESRIAHQCGEGFYTIGPCGEELLAGVGLALRTDDAAALHYRHLGTAVARALRSGKSMDDILLDRARGFCVSSRDPVSGGHHCLLGGGQYDFLVTSTLASQAPPAVGRAAGLRLAHFLGAPGARLPSDAVSYVSVGDGSVNNAHFLSAINFAEYMQHRGFQCPVVFGISDNGLCISLSGHGWLDRFVQQRLGMPVFRADGNSLASVFAATRDAAAHARSRKAPAAVVFSGLVRRFGHAATDRQDAYLSAAAIEAAEAHNALAGECARAVEWGVTSYSELAERFEALAASIEAAFDAASSEPKIADREAILRHNSQPLASEEKVFSTLHAAATKRPGSAAAEKEAEETRKEPPQVMRRHMTRVFDELLTLHPNLVYIGEDVQHGGYYRVTDGLREKHGLRVADFPPDETSLMGAAIGYAQAGLLPIVEIPYAKYLDCGGDMFFEAVIMNWLSAGRQPCGMVIRLQGFDKGVFGGNFHTHNSLHLPPGLDVVAYSNGADYVRGLRYAVAQAKAGRVVLTVDSTDLLNRRHLGEKDDQWLRPYPVDPTDFLPFDRVQTYGDGSESQGLLIVSYGNGVPTALRAAAELRQKHGLKVTVADAPYLSDMPSGLEPLLASHPRVVFADVCKHGQHPFAGHIARAQDRNLLQNWRSVTAARTYNPLGCTATFLSEADIVAAALAML